MAGASDKARFYLEQSVPELQELERKKIFSREEISQIAKKRSDFEHKLNARGSSPSDYARYAEYEMNVETLRRKRVRRLGIKVNSHAGQRRIFFVLDRATRKFQGDLGLWMQYIEYTQREKAYKKLGQIFASVLRFHPIKPEFWILAARHAIEVQTDMTSARSYMQRGLRFCKSSKLLWLEYAKLEMSYIAKIAARRKILGIEGSNSTSEKPQDVNPDVDAVALVGPEDVDPSSSKDAPADQEALQTLSSTPALTGAIPLAVFDAAMKQFQNDEALALNFFDLFADFRDVPCLPTLLQHVVNQRLGVAPTAPTTLICHIRQPFAQIDYRSAEAPGALSVSLSRLRPSFEETPRKAEFIEQAILWLHSLLQLKDLDEDIYRVLRSTLRQTRAAVKHPDISNDAFSDMMGRLERAGHDEEAQKLQQARDTA
ncbi:MAG: cytosolic factor, phosphatidylinositol/phosphatidylcholine transfer protein [Chaenotheca gracillima]|nr:MAG: cytosolic factor, phosphatidylinositol/phosphatidylcholine transfer protein [Chaenotheca gracillima]